MTAPPLRLTSHRKFQGFLYVLEAGEALEAGRCPCGAPVQVRWMLLPLGEIANSEADFDRVRAEGQGLCGGCGQKEMGLWGASVPNVLM